MSHEVENASPDMGELLKLSPEDFAAAMVRLAPAPMNPPSLPCSQSVVNIATALAKAQGAFPIIPRDRKVTVRMKDKPNGQPGGSYTFSYAPLSTIREKTRPALAENGLSVVQPIILEPTASGVVEVLRTILLHSSGEWLACDVPMFSGTGDNKAQAYNSGATYARRLGVTLLLCIAADEDDDGNGGEQDKPTPDYERQERATYRGSFPKQGGGSTQPRQPRPPQRKASTDNLKPIPVDYGSDREPSAGDLVDTGTGEVMTPWGSDLSAGQVSFLQSKARGLKLSDAEFFARYGTVTSDTINDVLAQLKEAADAAMG